LVHDACLEIFKLVCRDTTSAIRPINLRDFLSIMDLGLADRNRGSFDWGYGDTFSEGPRFEFEGWVSWEDSEVCETVYQRWIDLAEMRLLTKYKVDRDRSQGAI
jgi:hypothetical protein